MYNSFNNPNGQNNGQYNNGQQNNQPFNNNGQYHNGQYNNAPYNNYNRQNGYFNPYANYNNPWNNYNYQLFQQKNQDKQNLKKLSLYAGAAFLSYIFLQYLLVAVMQITPLYDMYINNPLVATACDIILSVVGILLPFLFFGNKMKQLSPDKNCYNFKKPSVGFFDCFLAIVSGVGLCMLANIITGIFTSFVNIFGVEPSVPELSMPTGVWGVFLNVLRTVVIAGFVEEISLRGTVMGNLRQYGDKFAIFASAFVFALMHGNLIQTPFAFIAGFGLGYLGIKCGSLWISVIIHMVNNGLSVLITYLVDIVPEDIATTLQVLMIYGLSLLGIICFVVFRNRTASTELRQNTSSLTNKEMAAAYFTTPTMLISTVIMLIITAVYVSGT